MFKVLISDALASEGVQLLKASGRVQVITPAGKTPTDLLPHLAECDAWIVRSATKVTRDLIAAASKLRVIARAGVGVDNVDVEAATQRGIVVMNSPDSNAITTAELAVSYILALARNMVRADRGVREGRWAQKDLIGTEITGKTLGVLGAGNIGRRVIQRALGLEMKVLVYDPYVAREAFRGTDVEVVSLDQLIAHSDFITIHVPLNDKTRNLIDARAIAAMRPGVRLINCARGGIIDEAALFAGLQSGHVGGAGLDVFEREPPPADHPLLGHPNVILTPHLGASTEEAQRKVSQAICEQVLEFLTEDTARNAVNLPAVSREALAQVAPYMELAERLGAFVAQFVAWPITAVDGIYRGSIRKLAFGPVSRSFLKGLLAPVMDRPINLVNAPLIARERGIAFSERTAPSLRDFRTLLSYRLMTRDGPVGVAGTLFGRRLLRIVRIDEYRVEVIPEGVLLVIENEDRPGVLGRIGTLLGQHGVNISNLHLAARGADLALCVLNVDQKPPAPVLEQMRQVPEIRRVVAIELPPPRRFSTRG
ncbi:MAG: phosphoglycerate dehydrogenase [Planctomycetota bacterium]